MAGHLAVGGVARMSASSSSGADSGSGSGPSSNLAGANVLVLGASSQVGWFVIPRLIAAGARPVALSRVGQPSGFPDFDAVSWIDAGQLREQQQAISHLVSAGPLPLALELANDLPALRAMSVTSSSSVLSKSESPNDTERELMSVIAGAEKGLHDLASKRELPLLIVRPTLLYGAGKDRSISLLAKFIRRFGVMPISTHAGGMRQPLHVDDLAQALVAGLVRMGSQSARMSLTGALCGGETLDYRAMVRRLFQALNRPPRFMPISPGVLAPGLDVMARLGLMRGVNGQMVRRQAINLVFDDQQLRKALDVSPRRFSPSARDLLEPEPGRLQRLSQGV